MRTACPVIFYSLHKTQNASHILCTIVTKIYITPHLLYNVHNTLWRVLFEPTSALEKRSISNECLHDNRNATRYISDWKGAEDAQTTNTHTQALQKVQTDTFHVTKYLKIIINIHTHPLLHNVTVPIASFEIISKARSLHLRYTHKRKIDKREERWKGNKSRDRQKEWYLEQERVHMKFKILGEIQHWMYTCMHSSDKLHNTVELKVQMLTKQRGPRTGVWYEIKYFNELRYTIIDSLITAIKTRWHSVGFNHNLHVSFCAKKSSI